MGYYPRLSVSLNRPMKTWLDVIRISPRSLDPLLMGLRVIFCRGLGPLDRRLSSCVQGAREFLREPDPANQA